MHHVKRTHRVSFCDLSPGEAMCFAHGPSFMKFCFPTTCKSEGVLLDFCFSAVRLTPESYVI